MGAAWAGDSTAAPPEPLDAEHPLYILYTSGSTGKPLRFGRTAVTHLNWLAFALRDHLPPTYPHVLAFPLQMAVMADGSFPFGAVGLVVVDPPENPPSAE